MQGEAERATRPVAFPPHRTAIEQLSKQISVVDRARARRYSKPYG
jgi:hypothetical protein